MTETELLRSFDARDWAREFCDIYETNHGTRPDEGWMISWFANALMRGFDEHRWRMEAEAREKLQVGEPETPPPSSGVQLIAAERQRQISVEGWSPEHDDTHTRGEILDAASCYLFAANGKWETEVAIDGWPWDRDWWKPSADPIRNLVKAGALIAAEIDRLQRASGQAETPPPSGWQPKEKGCDHKFVDSTVCLKCGVKYSDLIAAPPLPSEDTP